jgi:TrmH family RNA methyltransferase
VADHPAVLTKAELQRLRSLREKKNREALGLFVIEGEKVVGELIAAQFPFIEIYATSEWPGISGNRLPPGAAAPPPRTNEISSARTRSVKHESSRPGSDPSGMNALPPDSATRVTRVTADEMARASHFPTPSNVLAVGRISRPDLTPGGLERGLTLALDGVQDAGNVGTLLRVADWFAFDRVILSPDCADLFHQKVINASMGSFARILARDSSVISAMPSFFISIISFSVYTAHFPFPLTYQFKS